MYKSFEKHACTSNVAPTRYYASAAARTPLHPCAPARCRGSNLLLAIIDIFKTLYIQWIFYWIFEKSISIERPLTKKRKKIDGAIFHTILLRKNENYNIEKENILDNWKNLCIWTFKSILKKKNQQSNFSGEVMVENVKSWIWGTSETEKMLDTFTYMF